MYCYEWLGSQQQFDRKRQRTTETMKNELVDTSRVVFSGAAITLEDLFDFNQRLLKPVALVSAQFRANLVQFLKELHGSGNSKDRAEINFHQLTSIYKFEHFPSACANFHSYGYNMLPSCVI